MIQTTGHWTSACSVQHLQAARTHVQMAVAGALLIRSTPMASTLPPSDNTRPSAQPSIAGKRGNVLAQPIPYGHRKAGLAPRRDFGRLRMNDRPRELGLGRRIRAGEHRRERPQHGHVNERDADLDAVSHAGPIGIAHELVAHVPRQFEGRDDATLIRTQRPNDCRIAARKRPLPPC